MNIKYLEKELSEINNLINGNKKLQKNYPSHMISLELGLRSLKEIRNEVIHELLIRKLELLYEEHIKEVRDSED